MLEKTAECYVFVTYLIVKKLEHFQNFLETIQ